MLLTTPTPIFLWCFNELRLLRILAVKVTTKWQMAHLVTRSFVLFFLRSSIQANSKSFKNRWNTTFEAKGQQYTVGKVIQRLFNTDLYIVSDILLQKDAVAVNYDSKSFTKKNRLCGFPVVYLQRNPRPRVYWCPGQYGGAGWMNLPSITESV